jgi:hypothetical protein
MNEKLKIFLEAKKDAETKKYEETKQKTLIDLGLYEKVYSPDNKYSEEFSSSEWNVDDQVNKYYKKVPIEITDEEYQEVKKYAKKEVEDVSNNPVAIALTIIAWVIFIGGFIAGIALATVEVEKGYIYKYTDTEFSFAIAFVYWCASLISGTMFLGFAEIIKLLNDIKRK